MPGTIAQLTYDGLSVHHAVSLEEDYDRCLDDDNLLTVCGLHHEMAEERRDTAGRCAESDRGTGREGEKVSPRGWVVKSGGHSYTEDASI